MLVSTALAQPAANGTPPSAGGGLIEYILLIGALFAILYFFLLRPQIKQQRQHQQMAAGLRRGDRVVTGGGLIGQVVRAPEGEEEITVEIAEGTRVRVLRQTVARVLEKKGGTGGQGTGGQGNGGQDGGNGGGKAPGGKAPGDKASS